MPDLCPVKVVALAEDRTRLDCTTYFLSGKNKVFFPSESQIRDVLGLSPLLGGSASAKGKMSTSCPQCSSHCLWSLLLLELD